MKGLAQDYLTREENVYSGGNNSIIYNRRWGFSIFVVDIYCAKL